MTINRARMLTTFVFLSLSACEGAVPRADERQPSHPPVVAPPPLPPRAPVAVVRPLQPAVLSDWRDVPLPAGDWIWTARAGGSVATFGVAGQPPVAILHCDRAAGVVHIALPWDQPPTLSTAARQATITTSTSSATLPAAPLSLDGQAMLAITVRATDHLLDAMAFSRGRFRVQITGIAPIVLPSWSQVGRVVEDCRE